MIQGRSGPAGDLGDGVLGHPEPEEMTDLILLAIEARDTERSLGPPELLARRSGLGETLAGALGDQVALDFCEQREERRHDLGLNILLALNADLLLDGDEGDAFPGQCVEYGDDLAERSAKAGELADDQAVSGFEGAHQVIERAVETRR